MQTENYERVRDELLSSKADLSERLERIKDSVKRGYEADSKERAVAMENVEVVDALGNEIQRELLAINAALARIEAGVFGVCRGCGEAIPDQRLAAQPFADVCIDCAEYNEEVAAHSS